MMDFNHEAAKAQGEALNSIGKLAVEISKGTQEDFSINGFLLFFLKEWAVKNKLELGNAVNLAILAFLKDRTAIDSVLAGMCGVDDEVIGLMQEDED